MKVDDFSKLLKIDRNRLDEELEQNPSLYYDVASESVLASSRADEAKEKLALMDADLSLQIRRDAEKAGEKVTESIVQSRIMLDSDRQEASTQYLEARKDAETWKALKDAFHQRAYAIRDLAGLYSTDYFGTRSVKSPEAEEQGIKRRRAQIREASAAMGRK